MSKMIEVYQQLAEKELSSVWPQWKISGFIGIGEFAEVYEIERNDYGHIYKSALKIIHLEDSFNKTVSFDHMNAPFDNGITPQCVLDEINNLEQLKGAPNIVVIEDHAFIYEEGEYTILIRMELLENLRSYIKRKGALSSEEIIKLGIDICEALSYCEKKNIIHRDIKEDNLFYSPLGDFKLGDFGISKQLEGLYNSATMTRRYTSYYVAPEIFAGEKYDATVDTYSLGLVLYKLLNNNRYPFCSDYSTSATSEDAIRANDMRLQKIPLPPPSNAPEELGLVICKACNPERGQRYKSAHEFKEALEYCLKSIAKKDHAYALPQDRLSINLQGEKEKQIYKTEDSTSTRSEISKKSEEDKRPSALKDMRGDTKREGKRISPKGVIISLAGVFLVLIIGSAFLRQGVSPDGTDAHIETDAPSNNELPDFYISENEATVGGCEIYPCIFNEKLRACKKIRVGYKLNMAKGDIAGTFAFWVRWREQWLQIGTFELYESEEEYVKTFVLNPPRDIDAFGITPLGDYNEDVYWSPEYVLYEVELVDLTKEHEHQWIEATCTDPQICSICGEIEGAPLGHKWKDATYDTPKTCERCGETEGNVKGYIDSDRLDGSFSDDAIELNDCQVQPYVFAKQLKKCRKIRLGCIVNPEEGDPTGTFSLWILSDGQWSQKESININQAKVEYKQEFVFDPAQNIEALCFVKDGDVEEEVSWNCEYVFYDAQVD